VSYASFASYDVDRRALAMPWSGWVTYDGDLCSGRAQTAVTPTGECVLVGECMPLEFQSCSVKSGCCDTRTLKELTR
jgi:hypothetical protein